MHSVLTLSSTLLTCTFTVCVLNLPTLLQKQIISQNQKKIVKLQQKLVIHTGHKKVSTFQLVYKMCLLVCAFEFCPVSYKYANPVKQNVPLVQCTTYPRTQLSSHYGAISSSGFTSHQPFRAMTIPRGETVQPWLFPSAKVLALVSSLSLSLYKHPTKSSQVPRFAR